MRKLVECWVYALLVSAAVLSASSAASAQTYASAWTCPRTTFFNGEIPVYFSADTLAAHGFNADEFRASVIRAIHVWNEEARAPVRLRWAGDAPGGSGTTGAITIFHQAQAACGATGTELAYAVASNAYCQGFGTASIDVNTENCGVGAGTVPWNPTIAGPGERSYEGVLVHELGHILLATGDQYSPTGGCPATGVMCGVVSTGSLPERLHLYPVDQNTAGIVFPAPSGTPTEGALSTIGVLDAWYTGNWTTSDRTLGVSASMGPGLHRRTLGDPSPNFEVFASNASRSTFLQARGYGTIQAVHSPPSSMTTTGSVRFWPRVAVSIYGEILLTWVSCTDIISPCRVKYAYTDNPDVGTSWITGEFSTLSTYAPATVAYDELRDKFAVIFLNAATLQPVSAWTSAWRPSFAMTAPVDATIGTWTQKFRYVGGLVMEHDFTNEGQWTASATFGSSPRHVTITRLFAEYDAAGSRYALYPPVPAVNDGVTWFDTPRHFGMTRFGSIYYLFLVWLRNDNSGTLAYSFANAAGLDFVGAYNAPSISGVGPIVSSVSTTQDYGPDGVFAVGFAAY